MREGEEKREGYRERVRGRKTLMEREGERESAGGAGTCVCPVSCVALITIDYLTVLAMVCFMFFFQSSISAECRSSRAK